MPDDNELPSKKVLVVARWPLGGIRTYMRYMFHHLPSQYRLTLLAAVNQENEALMHDAAGYGADLVISRKSGTFGLIQEVMAELGKSHYDVILSQGFISAVAVYFANISSGIPHVLTIHGVVEEKYLTGNFAWAKRILMEQVLSRITVHYAVSKDILEHLHEQFPGLKGGTPKVVVIPNGIDLDDFSMPPQLVNDVRRQLGLPDSMFLFGFFGRFMHQKGFDLLIDAVERLHQEGIAGKFVVLAVGSGDFLESYQQEIVLRNLQDCFVFLPFQPQMKNLYQEVDAVVMPSRWEASGLLAMESMIMGVPLIAADCIGLRETVAGTPACVFPAESTVELAARMTDCITRSRRNEFLDFVPQARKRFDVASSARQLARLISEMPEHAGSAARRA